MDIIRSNLFKSWILSVLIFILFGTLLYVLADTIEVTDAEDKVVKITSSKRIVSLNGSTTEILFALGVGDRVVGCDASSTYPKGVREKLPSVGYQYGLNAEGILSLKPTLVIGREDVRPPQVVEQLRMSGVTVLLLKEPRSFKQAKERLLTIGTAVGRSKKAEELTKSLDGDIKKLEEKLNKRKGKPKLKALFMYLRGTQTTLVLGKDTVASAMFDIVAVENAAGEIKGNKPMTAEAVVAAQPDVYVLFTTGLESVGGVDGLLKIPGLAHTPAGKNRRVVAMSGQYFSGFGPRSGKAALDLFRGIYEKDGLFVAEGEEPDKSLAK
ncbi:hemin ABC transporter substrate-binding protein [Candidatus Poribacteria bacterium]|nr:hemin ABC transporter substrate-binding protein [Candidatus Poribacteria bacterium]MYB64637.1 hemin ABC transporter substrate-binding protein [Candidatus Poribacteria bacterium]MYF54256.1 hemin ABC transporter substrate-binding protein [Candidatus Poribacteria bacterium]MYI94701.1 hemin ABC transporter substrate-binding protein [Candidatus Poribacteria bacterium]